MAFFKLGNTSKMVQGLKSKLLASRDNAIIHNKFILYFILLISLGNLFYLSVEQDFMSITVFVLVGFLTSFFSKNMLVILFIALTITNILKYGSNVVQEGATNKDESEDAEEIPEEKESKETSKKNTGEKRTKKSSSESFSKKESSKKTSDSVKDNFDPQSTNSELIETLKSMSKIAEALKNEQK